MIEGKGIRIKKIIHGLLKFWPLCRVGVVSDVVKTMTWTLGLPTLSTSFGEEGEIRHSIYIRQKDLILIEIFWKILAS